MKILIINGPNLNMLGSRETDVYGNKSLSDLESMLIGKKHDVNLEFFQSNSEKDFILKFNQMIKLSDTEKKKFRVNAKKKIKIFSIFHHFRQLHKIISYG